MVYLDLFSGIGGFHKGILDAGVKIEKCYFSEIDKYAIQIYKRHFPNAIELGNAKYIKGKMLGEINILTFGSPCQDISSLGYGQGLRGKQSALFFKAIRIIEECEPNIFIFENVEELLSSNDKKDFECVLRLFSNIGFYNCEWQLLNTIWFLPQNRPRIYLIGHHIGKPSGQKVFPIIPSFAKHFKTLENSPKTFMACLTTRSSLARRIPDFGWIYTKKGIRTLTPIEYERLQGYQDNWTEEISDTQRYKCLGNAVSVPIVKMIIEKLFTIHS